MVVKDFLRIIWVNIGRIFVGKLGENCQSSLVFCGYDDWSSDKAENYTRRGTGAPASNNFARVQIRFFVPFAKNWRNCNKIAKISFKYTLYNCEILGKLQDLNRSIQGMKFIFYFMRFFGQVSMTCSYATGSYTYSMSVTFFKIILVQRQALLLSTKQTAF